jgi:ATP-dependent RNA helicase DeaD
VPTVAELRSKRLDVTRASIRELILAGDLDDVRVVVGTLAQEFDIVAIAAAAVKLAHAAEAGDDSDREIPPIPNVTAPGPRASRESGTRGPDDVRRPGGLAKSPPGGPIPKGAPRHRPRDRSAGAEGVARLFVGAGREAGIRPGDLVGAITGEAGINSRELGAIEIADRFSLVEVPESRANDIMAALRATTIRGRKVSVRRDRVQEP